MVDSIAVELSSSRPDAGDAERALDTLKAIAEPVRWEILAMLAEQKLCVCDIQERIPAPANLLSYHLKVLREAGLVTGERRGRWIDYSLTDDAEDRMRAALPGAAVVAPSR